MTTADPPHIPAPHIPVMMEEVLAALAIVAGECHVDATFGAGGHTRAMIAAGARVIACDRDPSALAAGANLEATSAGALLLLAGRYGALESLLTARDIRQVDGILFDIGVSSMQLDQGERGFSFQKDGPLDMRMSQIGETAEDWLNRATEADISRILYLYSGERYARRIARAIVAARPLVRTGELATLIRRTVPRPRPNRHRAMAFRDPATRSFQAIRIHINDELGELRAGLAAAESLLNPGGRLVVLTFHSLEDRIVKQFLREASAVHSPISRHHPAAGTPIAPLPTVFARPLPKQRPTVAECAQNPRARSAILRSAVRTQSPARRWEKVNRLVAGIGGSQW